MNILIENKEVFIISDIHFFHTNIIKYCNRPFKSVDEMNEVIMNNWNETISNADVVFFLGDFVIGSSNKDQVSKIIYDNLNGEKYFIRGNHDKYVTSIPYIDELVILSYEGKTFTLGHYQKATFQTDYSIHGHSHNNPITYVKNSFNASIENINYYPINIREIVKNLNV